MNIFLLLIFWNIWFLIFSSRTIFSPLLPLIEQELNLSHALAGSIFLFLSLGYTITLILASFLSLCIGYKRTIIVGFALATIALFSLKFVTTYITLAVFTIVIGIGTGIYKPSIIPLITETFAPQKWGKAIAIHDTASSFSIFSVPILIAIALRFFNWKSIFFILSCVCLICIILFLVFAPDPRPQKEDKVRFFSVLYRREFLVMALLWIFGAASNMGLYNVIPLFLVKEKGMPIEMASSVFGITRIGGIFVTILAGLLADRYSVKRILTLAFLITGISTIFLAFAKTFPFLVAILILQATVSNAFFPVGSVASSKLTTLNERSIFVGATMAVGVGIGFGLTPVLLGAVADTWNFQSGILILGIFTAFSCLSLKSLKNI